MAYNEIPDNEIDVESPGTEYVKRRLRDNPIGMVAGDAGHVYSRDSFFLVPGEAPQVTPTNSVLVDDLNLTKRFGFVCPVIGSIRTKYTMQRVAGTGLVYGQIYINGSPDGILQNADDTAQEFIQDLEIATPSSIIELRLMVSAGSQGLAGQFGLYAVSAWQFTSEYSPG